MKGKRRPERESRVENGGVRREELLKMGKEERNEEEL